MHTLGIHSALALKNASPNIIRQHLSVVGERIVYELRGLSCLHIKDVEPQKSIRSSRSFGMPLTNVDKIEEALSTYTASACERLRAQKSKLQSICVFMKTSDFVGSSATYSFECPTSDTSLVTKKAESLLQSLYKKNVKYRKVGIVLLDLVDEAHIQKNLFGAKDQEKRDKLMNIIDQVNHNIGRDSLFFLSQGTTRDWQVKAEKRSPRYTTNWNELPCVF